MYCIFTGVRFTINSIYIKYQRPILVDKRWLYLRSAEPNLNICQMLGIWFAKSLLGHNLHPKLYGCHLIDLATEYCYQITLILQSFWQYFPCGATSSRMQSAISHYPYFMPGDFLSFEDPNDYVQVDEVKWGNNVLTISKSSTFPEGKSIELCFTDLGFLGQGTVIGGKMTFNPLLIMFQQRDTM